MLTIISFNLSLLIVFLIIFFVLWSLASKNLFFDITFFLLLGMVIAPIVLSIINIIFIIKNNLAIWSYLIPLLYVSIPIIKIFLEEKTQKRDDEVYETYVPEIRLLIGEFFNDLSIIVDDEDVFIVKIDSKKDNKHVFKVMIGLENVHYNKDFLVKKLYSIIREELPDIELEISISVSHDLQKKNRFMPTLV
ncbi:RNA helicase [Bacillus cereus]|uniref:RNA helicase n=1 Tax=Bacillus cereus TaxID=1396 RepID=UPI003CFEAAC2